MRPAPNGEVSGVSGNGAAASRPGPSPKGTPLPKGYGVPSFQRIKGHRGSGTFCSSKKLFKVSLLAYHVAETLKITSTVGWPAGRQGFRVTFRNPGGGFAGGGAVNIASPPGASGVRIPPSNTLFAIKKKNSPRENRAWTFGTTRRDYGTPLAAARPQHMCNA